MTGMFVRKGEERFGSKDVKNKLEVTQPQANMRPGLLQVTRSQQVVRTGSIAEPKGIAWYC